MEQSSIHHALDRAVPAHIPAPGFVQRLEQRLRAEQPTHDSVEHHRVWVDDQTVVATDTPMTGSETAAVKSRIDLLLGGPAATNRLCRH